MSPSTVYLKSNCELQIHGFYDQLPSIVHHHGNTIIEVLWEEHCRGITVVGGPSPLCGGYSLVLLIIAPMTSSCRMV